MAAKISCKIKGSFLKDASSLINKLHTVDVVASAMNNVGVKKDGNVIELSFGGYGSGAKTYIPCVEADDGDFQAMIGSKIFSDILSCSCGDDEEPVLLEYHIQHKIISIASSNKFFKINSVDMDIIPFPAVSIDDVENAVEFCPKRFFNCVDFGASAADPNSADQNGKYLFFINVKDDTMCYGADLAKMHISAIDKELSMLAGISVIAKPFKDAMSMAAKFEKATIGTTKNSIAIKFGDSIVKLPCVDVKPKPVERVLGFENNTKFKFEVSAEQMRESVSAVSKMMTNNAIVFDVKEDAVTLITSSLQNGDAAATVKYTSKSGECLNDRILFGHNKIAPLMNKCRADSIAFSVSEKTMPVYARFYGDDQEFLAVIMPAVNM